MTWRERMLGRPSLTVEQDVAIGKALVRLAVELAPRNEGEALHGALMNWLDEEVIDETDPKVARLIEMVTEAIAGLSALMDFHRGVPGRTKGKPVPARVPLRNKVHAILCDLHQPGPWDPGQIEIADDRIMALLSGAE